MLGIPMGSRKLKDLEQRPSKDPFIKEWENQFKHVKKPTPAAISSSRFSPDPSSVSFAVMLAKKTWCPF
ncbi:hypothetical protein Tco_0457156, partial [Tanacetum coccineum]